VDIPEVVEGPFCKIEDLVMKCSKDCFDLLH
jgi:hypothetical protein